MTISRYKGVTNLNANMPFSSMDYCYAILNKHFDAYYTSDNFYNFLSIPKDSPSSVYDTLFKNRIGSKLTKLHSTSNDALYYVIKDMTLFGKNINLLLVFDFTHFELLQNSINNLLEELHLNNSILNSLQDGVFITDEKGETLFVNDAFTNLSGLAYDDVVGYNVFDLLKENIVPNSSCTKVINSGMPASTINKYYSGKECLVSANPIFNLKGELKKVVSSVHDLSELQSLKLKLEKTTSLSIIYKNKIKELQAINSDEPIITRSKKMNELYDIVSNIANIDSNVLILGETGVGKDFLSNYIHHVNNKKDKGPFLKINCSAIPEHLLESELFGYEAGAFTGASKNGKVGLFQLANNGTLFLDEIGDMPYNLQSKLLTILQDKTMYRIGGSEVIKINARIIAATNADLTKLIEEKKFRADLYYRLNVINFTIPPIRERKEDIIPFAESFLKEFNAKYQKNRYYSSDMYNALLDYCWPGNIREMKNIIERLVIISRDDLINSDIFYSQLLGTQKRVPSNDDTPSSYIHDRTPDLKANLEKYEAHLIQEALNKCNTLHETADYLNVTLSTLVRRKRKYRL